ncbi:MAG: nitroreductase [Kangiella sp.]|nr:MAG: nitroreductase [Kangiella sp.]
MPVLETLMSRKSHNKLVAPAPSKTQVEQMMKFALRAPDHASLKPWRYQVFTGQSLIQLGEFFAKASQWEDSELSFDELDKLKSRPLRAPMVIIASVFITEHPKVPEIEQYLSAGASVQNLLLAAHFMNIGAIWRTDSLCFNRHLMDLLGLKENESIVGFIYLGKEEGKKRLPKHVEQSEFVAWK